MISTIIDDVCFILYNAISVLLTLILLVDISTALIHWRDTSWWTEIVGSSFWDMIPSLWMLCKLFLSSQGISSKSLSKFTSLI
jgi:hypothetical protein